MLCTLIALERGSDAIAALQPQYDTVSAFACYDDKQPSEPMSALLALKETFSACLQAWLSRELARTRKIRERTGAADLAENLHVRAAHVLTQLATVLMRSAVQHRCFVEDTIWRTVCNESMRPFLLPLRCFSSSSSSSSMSNPQNSSSSSSSNSSNSNGNSNSTAKHSSNSSSKEADLASALTQWVCFMHLYKALVPGLATMALSYLPSPLPQSLSSAHMVLSRASDPNAGKAAGQKASTPSK